MNRTKDNYLTVRISRDSDALWDKRIVMSSWTSDDSPYPYLDIEWRALDALDHESWNAAEYKSDDEKAACRVLAFVIINKLGAWPHWYPLASPEVIQSPAKKDDEIFRVCEIRCSTGLYPGEQEHVRILHSEQRDQYHPDHPNRHYSRVESASEDGLGILGWRYVGYESDSLGYAEPFTVLLEVAVTLLGMRFGEDDHRQNFYKAEVVAAT